MEKRLGVVGAANRSFPRPSTRGIDLRTSASRPHYHGHRRGHGGNRGHRGHRGHRGRKPSTTLAKNAGERACDIVHVPRFFGVLKIEGRKRGPRPRHSQPDIRRAAIAQRPAPVRGGGAQLDRDRLVRLAPSMFPSRHAPGSLGSCFGIPEARSRQRERRS
jgi:hypothetical protein